MDIKKIIDSTQRPKLYEKGSAFMWNDPHISKQLLEVHLNPEIDLASRKRSTIEDTAKWIIENVGSQKKLKILDLGCGPGLYTELFAKSGHNVTGVDISKNSIEYAINSAKKDGLKIDYKNGSYLEIDLGDEKYDLIILIYTDLGVLLPEDRRKLLHNIYRSLKKGGVLIFDLLKDCDLTDRLSPKSWDAKDHGFWKGTPYLALSESFLYQEEKVILYQHSIFDSRSIETYRFWTHYFSQKDILDLLEPHNFNTIKFRDDILPQGDQWNGDNVIFTICEK